VNITQQINPLTVWYWQLGDLDIFNGAIGVDINWPVCGATASNGRSASGVGSRCGRRHLQFVRQQVVGQLCEAEGVGLAEPRGE
jgi:hypothetical protein